MTMVDLTCPRCGGRMKVPYDKHKKITCPYCSAELRLTESKPIGTASMVFGVLSMITLGFLSIFGFIALIFGIICLNKLPNKTQEVHSVIGIVTGMIGIFLFVGLLLSMQ